MSTTIVSVTTDEQIEKVSNMAHEIWTEHYTPIIGIKQVNYMLESFQSRESIKRQISEGYLYYIAMRESEAGYLSIQYDSEKKSIFLSKLYVLNQYRRNGIAGLFLNHVKEKFVPLGLSEIYLTVNKNNLGSIEAYKKLGFEITDTAVTDIGNGFVMDDFIMKLLIK